ncbi:unnamed protein product [Penicillium pancosmium]
MSERRASGGGEAGRPLSPEDRQSIPVPMPSSILDVDFSAQTGSPRLDGAPSPPAQGNSPTGSSEAFHTPEGPYKNEEADEADAASSASSAADVKAFIRAEVDKAVGEELGHMHAMIISLNSRIALLESESQMARAYTPTRRDAPVPELETFKRSVAAMVHFRLERFQLRTSSQMSRLGDRVGVVEHRLGGMAHGLASLWQTLWNIAARNPGLRRGIQPAQ